MGQEENKAQTEKRSRGRPKKPSIEQDTSILSETKAPLKMGAQESFVTLRDVQSSLTGLFSSVLGADPMSTTTMSTSALNLNEFNPFMQNNRLKMLSTTPSQYTPEEILSFLKQPQHHEGQLRAASASLSASQYLYYKILREAADVPLFKHYAIAPCLTKEEYLKKSFIDEEEFVEGWLSKFNVTNTLKRVALETKREGKATYVFRQCITEDGKTKETQYVTWQKLPTQHTKLTAIGEYGYIASFNLMIFLNPTFSPDQYPEFIQKIWYDLNDRQIVTLNPKKKQYDLDFNQLYSYSYLDNGITKKGSIEMNNQTYLYWVQLPQDLCFTFASDTSNAWAVPDTMGLFNALQELTDYSVLAGLVASTPLTAVLTGQAESISGAQPGQDQTVLAPHTMVAFQNFFNSMSTNNVQAFLAPFKDLKLQSLPSVPNASDIKTKAVQNFISTAGEGGVITATDKPSVAMIKGSQLMAASQYDFVTRQFETILNMVLQKWTGVKYRWRIKLWGDIYSFDSTVKIIKEIVASGGTFLLPKLASSYDLTMRDVRGINTYMDAFKIYDGFKTLGWAQAQQKVEQNGNEGQNGAGRPALDEGEIENDNTAASRDAGDNISSLKEFAMNQMCVICGTTTEEGHLICEQCEGDFGLGEQDG